MHIHYNLIRRLLQIIDYYPPVAAIHLSINSAASTDYDQLSGLVV